MNIKKRDNLIYCDSLEHLWLHLKIYDFSKDPYHKDVGKKGAEILLSHLREIFVVNPYFQQEYKKKLSQKVFYKKRFYFKFLRLYQSLNIYKKYEDTKTDFKQKKIKKVI